MDLNLDPDLARQQDEVDNKKRTIAILGSLGDSLASSQSFGNFFTGKMNQPSTGGSKMASAINDTVQDPIARQAKLYENYKNAQQAQIAKNEVDNLDTTNQTKQAQLKKSTNENDSYSNLHDPNSRESQAFRQNLKANFPAIAAKIPDFDNLAAADKDSIWDPLKFKEQQDTRREATAARLQQQGSAREEKSEKQRANEFMQTSALLESQRGSPAVAQAEKDLYASQKLSSLYNSKKNPNDFAAPQVQLMATEIAKMASGGVPSIHELQGLNPSTLPSSLAQSAQYFTNKPSSANAGAFLKELKSYSDALAGDAKNVIGERYGRILESRKQILGDDGYGRLKSQYMDRFKEPSQPSAPKIGDVDSGYRYKGGDPSDPKSWEKQ